MNFKTTICNVYEINYPDVHFMLFFLMITSGLVYNPMVEVVYVSRSLDMEELQMEIRKWFGNSLQIDHPPIYLTL